MPNTPDVRVAMVSRTSATASGGALSMPNIPRAPASATAAASRARVVEFFYGEPDRSLVELVHQGGGLASWQVGSADEARRAVDAGCDLVIVQGVEAGGHVRGRTALLPLLDEVLDVVAIPVLAAGGIATARSVAAVLAAGAAGARLGTRFVATEEADAHPAYVDALLAAKPEDTVLTTTFSVIWPDAPHRVLRSCVEAVTRTDDDVVGEIELSSGVRVPVARLAPPSPGRRTTGMIEAMALYAGQSVGAVHRVERAGDVVRELAAGVDKLLSQLC